MAGPQPFHFDEFGAAAPESGDAPAITPEAVETARVEGVAEGRRLAMESIAADETALLAEIAKNLEARRSLYEAEIAETGENLVALSRAFLEQFCGSIASAREIETAGDFLKKLIDHSDDRRAVRLNLAPASAERLGPKLADLIAARGLGDFVTLAPDASLKPGEVRIDWRGGGAKRTRAEITRSVDTLIQSFIADKNALNQEAQS